MTTTYATRSRKANAYAGSCRKCSGHVPAQTGYLGSKVSGRWTVEHTECPATAAVRPARKSTSRSDSYRYGSPYLHSRSSVRPRRACTTGGNCSSFGSGSSCGGYDCDGY